MSHLDTLSTDYFTVPTPMSPLDTSALIFTFRCLHGCSTWTPSALELHYVCLHGCPHWTLSIELITGAFTGCPPGSPSALNYIVCLHGCLPPGTPSAFELIPAIPTPHGGGVGAAMGRQRRCGSSDVMVVGGGYDDDAMVAAVVGGDVGYDKDDDDEVMMMVEVVVLWWRRMPPTRSDASTMPTTDCSEYVLQESPRLKDCLFGLDNVVPAGTAPGPNISNPNDHNVNTITNGDGILHSAC
ncbi:hypothetical protein Tco_1294101 [Tanacetum coccineum]